MSSARCAEATETFLRGGKPGARPRVALRSLGCRTNQEELELLRVELAANGFFVVDELHDADVAVVNSCTVTGHTEAKMRQLIRSIARTNPSIKILVTGCLAQQDPLALREMLGVHWVVGNSRKADIPGILLESDGAIVHEPLCSTAGLEISRRIPDPIAGARTRFSVKIQEGCDFACAYCIVPSVRGPSRWVPASDIRAVVEDALARGYKEIVLTGTHIGQYGGANGLAALIRELSSCEGDFRLRLSSLDPRDLSDDLVELICTSPRICDHVHVSIQSLCDAVLHRMARGEVEADSIVRTLTTIRRYRSAVMIGGDFIVGFPGETDEMVEETMTRVREARFGYGHVFRFSRRPGTLAAGMTDQVPESEKTARSLKLRGCLERSRGSVLKSLIGTRQRIIVEEESPASGLTSSYVRVTVPEVGATRNSWLDVEITASDFNRGRGPECRGRILTP